MAGAELFLKIDLASAYHQLLLHEDNRDLAAFLTRDSLFRFKRVCFELASSPSAFQKLVVDFLKRCRTTLCYLDDVVFESLLNEHTQVAKCCNVAVHF